VEHGAPLRLLVPVKLGLKNIKAITRITFTKDEPRILQDLERVGGQESRIAGTGATARGWTGAGREKNPDTLRFLKSFLFMDGCLAGGSAAQAANQKVLPDRLEIAAENEHGGTEA